MSADLKAMFEMIEDGDLWLWRLPGSREFYAGENYTLNMT